MREIFEILFSIGMPTAALVGYAIMLARREDRELRDEIAPAPGKRSRMRVAICPDPDAHLGRVGTE
jgi:hypothetical protein